jgi:hypothetical protein
MAISAWSVFFTAFLFSYANAQWQIALPLVEGALEESIAVGAAEGLAARGAAAGMTTAARGAAQEGAELELGAATRPPGASATFRAKAGAEVQFGGMTLSFAVSPPARTSVRSEDKDEPDFPPLSASSPSSDVDNVPANWHVVHQSPSPDIWATGTTGADNGREFPALSAAPYPFQCSNGYPARWNSTSRNYVCNF